MSVVREIALVAEIAMPVDEKWSVRRCRYRPEEGGAGRVCIVTGIHGDEMLGQLIVFGVAQRIMQEQEHLRGTVDLYPMLNPLGLDIGERLVPSGTRLDMNRSFPGTPDGTPMEAMCYQIVQEVRGADLVLDLHASTQSKSELYEVRISAPATPEMVASARALCPELIWVYPERTAYNASLTGALSTLGTHAMILEANEPCHRPQKIAGKVIDGIFCKLAEMGLWTGKTVTPPAEPPCVMRQEDILRVTCRLPGVYLPENVIGRRVGKGQVLGRVFDALSGEVMEEVTAPCDALVFSERSYCAVYPGTLLARLYKMKEEAQP